MARVLSPRQESSIDGIIRELIKHWLKRGEYAVHSAPSSMDIDFAVIEAIDEIDRILDVEP